ncbi:alpha/beta hydrolase [Dictyobacter aurantiacus]|uniref:Alpha/beta hydrolase n=1 Tax=Dictyobacter aurantiacus TaxID=1936993 RepID=A0A401ZMX9_9CHLR|nr:alpha/beta hydrolase [Dictyobacter aurantiacus]GCE08228.1 alpha/beta hydrolase [Dictyobacter aurantiacus]
MSIFGIVVMVIVVLVVLLLVASSLYFYRVGVYRQPKAFLIDNPDLQQIETSDLPIEDVAWVERQPFERIEMKSWDGLLLRAFYLPAPQPTTRTVVLAHGYTGSSKLNMGPFAQMYHEQFGYNVLMPDARGHGESEGNYIGFGWHERLDYVKWIHLLTQRLGEEIQVVLHGVSMGGATVLMTSGEPLPTQVKAVVADCAYTSAYDILAYQGKRMYHVPAFPFVALTSLVCKLRSGFFFQEASALKQVQQTRLPILFIHGAEDTFVPTAMVHQLHAACPTPKEMYVVPNAGHGLAYDTDPATYTNRCEQFLARFIA